MLALNAFRFPMLKFVQQYLLTFEIIIKEPIFNYISLDLNRIYRFCACLKAKAVVNLTVKLRKQVD
jgi:hypothetical protein